MFCVNARLVASLLEYKNPLFLFCVSILTGATFYFKDIKQVYLFAFCLIILIAFLFLKKKKILLIVFGLIFGYFYTFSYFKFFTDKLDYLLNKKYIYIGEMLTKPEDAGFFYKKYFLKLKSAIDNSNDIKNIKGKVQVLGSFYEEYSPGDVVQVIGTLKKPKKAILPGLFDESKYLLVKGIFYNLKADPGTLVFLDSPKEFFLDRKINEIREKLISTNKNHLKTNNLAVINGIIFGSKASKLPDDLKNKIQSLGLSHLTSASGFNVSILAFGIFILFRFFTRRKLVPTIISIFLILFYTAIADFSASIIRASVFIVLVLIGNLFDKKLKILPGLSFTVLLFFLANPTNLLDIGLELSIFAFLGILLFTNEEKPSLLLQSFFAQAMVMPLIVFYFHNIQLLGLISNLIAVPIASIILITGIISIPFAFVPHINSIFALVLNILSELFLAWVNFLDKIPFKQIFLPNLNFYFLILIYIGIIFFLCSLFIDSLRKNYKYFLPIFIVLLFLIYITTDTSRFLKIFFIPKYNQEAVLIVSPHEKPIYLTTRLRENDCKNLTEFLKLNSLSLDFTYYDLKDDNNVQYPSQFVNNNKNKITVKYKDFSFEIIKNYKDKITSKSNGIKLPILKKSDPPLNTVLLSNPDFLIVNDYKRLSKKSVKDIQWIKSQPLKAFFLSDSGTITIVTNGKKYNVALPEF